MIEVDQDNQIRRMMERAFDGAFQQQIGKLYSVFLTNPNTEQQKEFTKKGIENAIAAYRLAISAVDAWDDS